VSASVDGLDQLDDLIGEAEEQLQGLSHVGPARLRVTFPRHRGFRFCLSPPGGPGWEAGRQPGRGADCISLGYQVSGGPKWRCVTCS